jgi:hypothetical protein
MARKPKPIKAEGVLALKWSNLEAPIDDIRMLRAETLSVQYDPFGGGTYFKAFIVNTVSGDEFVVATFSGDLASVELLLHKAIDDAHKVANIMGFHS